MKSEVKERPTVRKSDLSREQILVAAARLFREQGYAETTLRQIAFHSNMKAGSIYYYFSSKEELLDAVLNKGMNVMYQTVTESVRALGEDVDFEERIRTAIQVHLHVLFNNGDFMSTYIRLLSQAPSLVRERNRAGRRAYQQYWEDLLDGAQKAGALRADIDIHMLTRFTLGAMNRSLEWFHPSMGSVQELAEAACDYLFNGILPRPRSPARRAGRSSPRPRG